MKYIYISKEPLFALRWENWTGLPTAGSFFKISALFACGPVQKPVYSKPCTCLHVPQAYVLRKVQLEQPCSRAMTGLRRNRNRLQTSQNLMQNSIAMFKRPSQLSTKVKWSCAGNSSHNVRFQIQFPTLTKIYLGNHKNLKMQSHGHLRLLEKRKIVALHHGGLTHIK